MNLIKTYFLPLILLLFISVPMLAQSNVNIGRENVEKVMVSKADSMIVNHYYTEEEYNRINKIEAVDKECDLDSFYEDEIYSNKKYKRKSRVEFWADIPAEIVVDVVVNTMFIISVLWQ